MGQEEEKWAVERRNQLMRTKTRRDLNVQGEVAGWSPNIQHFSLLRGRRHPETDSWAYIGAQQRPALIADTDRMTHRGLPSRFSPQQVNSSISDFFCYLIRVGKLTWIQTLKQKTVQLLKLFVTLMQRILRGENVTYSSNQNHITHMSRSL